MKAIVVKEFGSEEVLRLTEWEKPNPGPDQVRVEMHAAGINPVETYIRSGNYPALPALPYIPGKDGAGVVDAVGEGVSRLKKGDRVYVAAVVANYCSGTYAEYTVCDAEAVHPLPEGLTFAQGAGVGTPGLAAQNALFPRGKLAPGETVLIHGATGGVGSLAVQLARRQGARVLATAGEPEGFELLRELGAHAAFSHNEEGFTDRILEYTGGRGVDLVIEMLANVNLEKDLAMLALHGRIVVVGNRGSLEWSPRSAMQKDADIRGMLLANMSHRDYISNFYALTAAMEDGVHALVGRELPLENAAEAHRLVIGGGIAGKIILTME
ncbi:MAG: NADPH:quinone reductase [Oscillospiraceae bacterium]